MTRMETNDAKIHAIQERIIVSSWSAAKDLLLHRLSISRQSRFFTAFRMTILVTFNKVDYLAVYPPSTGMLVPVMYTDASDARKTTMPFMSVSFANLPRKVRAE